jgi:hypothetical protein
VRAILVSKEVFERMNWFHSGVEPPLRLITDVDDWPAEGPGWRRELPDALDVDCQLVVAGRLRAHLPMVVMASEGMAPELLDAADGFVLRDDPMAVVGDVLLRAARPEAAGLRERSDGPAMMSALSIEAARIAEALARLAADSGLPETLIPVEASTIRRLIRLRRDRERFFPAELFADPAWDMLLDLAAARLEGQRVSVSSLCIAAAVPTTTALRWVRTLSESGLFERHMDKSDMRRTWIGLSDAAAAGMLAWLQRFSDAFGRG